MQLMRRYPHIAVLAAMVHDESEGRVTLEGDGTPRLEYRMTDGDRAQLAAGLRAAARILFAAGAREVWLELVPPVVMRNAHEVERVDLQVVAPHRLPLLSVHPMGSLRMGDDPRTAVVQSSGEHHAVRGLFVLDGRFSHQRGRASAARNLHVRKAPGALRDCPRALMGGLENGWPTMVACRCKVAAVCRDGHGESM